METYFGKPEENNLSDDINEALAAELLKGKHITLKISCRISPCVVHYSYELRWPSSDNTLKEPDASGSFYYRF